MMGNGYVRFLYTIRRDGKGRGTGYWRGNKIRTLESYYNASICGFDFYFVIWRYLVAKSDGF